MVKTKINILDLRDSPWVDGPGRTILECAEDICKDRYRIIIGSFDSGIINGTPYEHAAQNKKLEVVRIKERNAFDIRILVKIICLVKKYKINILHTHDFRSNLMGIIAAKLSRRPIVATVHGWISNDTKSKVKIALDKWLVCQTDHIIAVSKATKILISRAASNKKFSVIPNALRLEKYCPQRQFGKFRKELGIECDETVIANIGRLSPEKGQALFIEAAKEIVKKDSKVRFLIIGVGPDKKKLEALVESNYLKEFVFFTGFRKDMHLIYNDIDLVIQTSLTEGMPNVVLESLLMEVPVIATDVGGTSEVISNGNTGVLIATGDLTGLIKHIHLFLENPNHLNEMAKCGREDVRKRFNHKDRVKKLETVYENVIIS